jgi:iron complex transport system substrate-binding protein
MSLNVRPLTYYFGIALLVMLLIGCQVTLPPGFNHHSQINRQPATQTVSASHCRKVKHALGTVRLCGQPQRVAVLNSGVLSLMLSLGHQPQGYADGRYVSSSIRYEHPQQQIPYLGQFITTQPMNLGSDVAPSLERLLLLKPDLILAGTSQENSVFSTIAPTVYVNLEQDWRANLSLIATAVDAPQKAKAVIREQAEQFEQVRIQLTSLTQTHPKVLVIGTDQLMSSIYVEKVEVSYLLEKIGFQSVFPTDVGWLTGKDTRLIDPETLVQLDADTIFCLEFGQDVDYQHSLQVLRQAWQRNPLLQHSRAWKTKRVYFLDYNLWGSRTGPPLSTHLILEQLPRLLVAPESRL